MQAAKSLYCLVLMGQEISINQDKDEGYLKAQVGETVLTGLISKICGVMS